MRADGDGPPARLTRRRFLEAVGSVGGSAAVSALALALGLTPGRAAGAPQLVHPLDGRRRRVLLLGGGLANLMAAYELEKAGYDCLVLEASHRIGGRNLTLRAGDRVDELGSEQVCTFDPDPHLYFNAGAARIPEFHHYVLHYCRELRIPLEPFINVNYNAWVHDPGLNGGERVRYRQLITDARGFMAELSSKSLDPAAFDTPLNADDVERLREFLRAYGDLDEQARYRGSFRAGLVEPGKRAPTPGMLDAGELRSRLSFEEILGSSFWRWRMHFGEFLDQSAPLLQPVGGMDRIVDGFVSRLRTPLLTRAQVQRIRVGERGVSVVYQQDGALHEAAADYCFNAIPVHLALGLDADFPPAYRDAMAAPARGVAMKVALQMRERFWEHEHVYGGISWTEQPMSQLWYPSHGIHAEKGVVLGAYMFFPEPYEHFRRLPPADRIEAALTQGERLHPGNYRRHVECGISIDWRHMPHHLGCASRWTEEGFARHLPVLQVPLRGRHFMVGDQVSHHPGWQEGAFSSAHHALVQLQEQVGQEAAT